MRTASQALVALLALVAACKEPAPQVTSLPSSSIPKVLGIPWTFTIENSDHQSVGTLKVRFTADNATSCLGGDWRKVIVVDFKSTGTPAFPGDEPLSYEFKDGKLVIGRNEVCDAYIMLGGELKDGRLSGEYYSLGWGYTKLGYVAGKPSN